MVRASVRISRSAPRAPPSVRPWKSNASRPRPAFATTATRLTDDQLHEAEAAFRRIAGKPRPLSFYLDYTLANYREPENLKPLSTAIEDYKLSKAH